MVNFPTWIPDCDSHSPALLDFFLCSDASICSTMAFPPLGNSDHVVVSVSSDFPSYSQQDALFHCIAYDYSCADWDALCDHSRDVPWEDIFRLSALLLLVNFVSWFRLELMYIPLIESISSSLTYLSSESKVKFRQASNCCKSILEAAKLAYANKTKEFITSQKLDSQDFWRIASSFLNKGKSAIPHLFNQPGVVVFCIR